MCASVADCNTGEWWKERQNIEKLLKINFMEKSILRIVHNIDGPITVNISSFPFFFMVFM